MKVLFVCSGNICRSAMAAAYMRHRMRGFRLTGIDVESAGTLGIEGEPPTEQALEILRREGIDASCHRSRGLDPSEVRAADFILVMTGGHLADVARLCPRGGGKRYLLRAFERSPDPAERPPDLEDPIGRPEEAYARTFDVIRSCVDNLIEHLQDDPS